MTIEEVLKHFPEQPVPTIIEKLFRKHADKGFVDFEVLAHDPTSFNQLLPNSIHDQFILIGQHGSGSLIAIWKEKKLPADQLPLVWIDSEGTPINVFANNFAEFLTLLPYDTGFIYDLISKWEYFANNPNSNPENYYDSKMLKEILEENRINYSSLAEYEKWLHDEMVLMTATNPVKMVGDAIRNHPGMIELLQKSK